MGRLNYPQVVWRYSEIARNQSGTFQNTHKIQNVLRSLWRRRIQFAIKICSHFTRLPFAMGNYIWFESDKTRFLFKIVRKAFVLRVSHIGFLLFLLLPLCALTRRKGNHLQARGSIALQILISCEIFQILVIYNDAVLNEIFYISMLCLTLIATELSYLYLSYFLNQNCLSSKNLHFGR